MSILDALRVQKAEQQSVRDLARLPQQLIIQMAQTGQIPADVAPVIISEKARMAKEAANAQALMQQSQGTPPSVIEQAMAMNAQAEAGGMPTMAAPMAPPQAAPMAAPQGIPGTVPTPEMAAIGVAALPTDGMFKEQNFAGGGIVAFDEGGDTSESMKKYSRRYESLADAIAEAQTARSPYRTPSPEEAAFMEYLQGQKPRGEKEMSQQGWMRALEAGLGIMGGESPYALTNIAKGSQAAAKGYGEDIAAQRKKEAAYLQSMAEQGRRKRLEGLEDVAAGEKLFEKDLEAEYRHATLNKDTDLRDTTKIYFNELVAQGADPKDPRTMATARRKAYDDVGKAAARISTQQYGIESQNRREASNYVEARLNKLANPEAIKLRRLEQEDKKNGTNTAEQYRTDLFNEAYSRISRGDTLAGPLGGKETPKAAPRAEPKAESKASIPPEAAAQLKEGTITTFANGQKWTLENGKPKQVK